MKVAICMTNAHCPKWLQIVIHSLKQNPNQVENDIFVACSWPGHNSVRAITETALGEGVTTVDCVRRKHSHATGLDELLEYVAVRGYTHFFALETDCRAMKPGWLDWFVNFMKSDSSTHLTGIDSGFDPKIGIAGFFWHEGDHHYNINPSGTLYRIDMLLKYHREARENKEGMFYHPRGNKADTVPGMDNSIKNVVGVFSETRGIKNPTDVQRDVILKGVPEAAWFEPGQWLYARLQGEWKEVRVPCDHIYMQYPGHTAPEGTYYGSKAWPQLIHYWGGSRAYDWKKHKVDDHFVKSCAPMWIRREDQIWKETVPEEYRSIVAKLNEEEDIIKKMNDNLGFIISEAL